MIIEIDPQRIQPRKIAQVTAALREGGVVAYPTDTSYGLGCDIFSQKALRRLHQIKAQPESKPFSFICPDLKDLSTYANVTNYAYKTLRRLLPGPYTFVLEGSRHAPKMVLTKRKTVGIRVPDHPVCLAIVQELGHPIASTTAMDGQGRALNTPWEIESELGHALDLVVDGGPAPGLLSSVIGLIGDEPQIIREGAGDVEEFRV
ncbi:Sua5/YciO/YrdC/YwlC family protein [Desulfarculus baarsii DSM 2075]|uniref:Sua5/YciO/YrdC/YwlC family protein n=1 Tax=Desulfarculus baarsii (strain ATCC 33931 / DSM 2075 / LMG 7858 / VKM B-1802 / 2st14) TaxID=644282 RepID=E1QKF5_DESB2|nr:L-threonylcarbamoyladenylate synthase [Desulfarculus baarsii]ADK86048.1 Sua5/YciO/YrdC/YwlC family protein [Desulfarculus baarsii DSM 2075]